MQKQVNDGSNITGRPHHDHTTRNHEPRTRSLWLRGGALLIPLVAVAIILQSAYHQETYAAVLKNNLATPTVSPPLTATTSAAGTFTDKNGQFTIQVSIATTLLNTPMLVHVHEGDCMGKRKVFIMIPKSSGPSGTVTLSQTFTKQSTDSVGNDQKTSLKTPNAVFTPLEIPPTIPATWFFNIHDPQIKDPAMGNKPWSLGCVPLVLTASSGGSQATASFTKATYTVLWGVPA